MDFFKINKCRKQYCSQIVCVFMANMCGVCFSAMSVSQLHVTMMYHDKQIIPLEPFLYHVVKSWTLHTGSSQDTAAAAFNAEVRKAVSWCFILCTDASTKKAW